MNIQVGDRVALRDAALSIPYIALRINRGYLNLYSDIRGTVIRFTNAGDKVGIQFDDQIFDATFKQSSFDNGCHGKGKLHHCLYIPATTQFLSALKEIDIETIEEEEKFNIEEEFDDELLLLL